MFANRQAAEPYGRHGTVEHFNGEGKVERSSHKASGNALYQGSSGKVSDRQRGKELTVRHGSDVILSSR